MPRLPVGTLSFFLGVLAASPALALDRPDEAVGDDDAGALVDLLEQEGIDLELDEDHVDDLREVLRFGFAETPSVDRTLQRILESPRLQVPAPAWFERLDRDVALARIRPNIAAPRGVTYDIPIAQHPLVDTYIDYFTGRGRWFFERWLARADRYMPIMQPILRARGLPEDTIYLAMIESGFVARAYSRAAASGFWQFIASTGKAYGLRQTSWIDERRDFIDATESAAAYLNDLYREFHDWHLAWAGYNAGGGRVRRAIARTGVKDFWAIVDAKALPHETRHYVPKILAAAIVAKNRAHYGFTSVEPLPALAYDEVTVDDAVALRVLSNRLSVPYEELEALNPSLLLGITPPRQRFTLRVPSGHGAAVSEWLASAERGDRMDYRAYQVRPGDTLWKIAAKMGSEIHVIREINAIRDPRSLRVGQQLIVPRVAVRANAGTTRRTQVARRSSPPKARPAADRAARARHVVSAGETLWSISQRYNVSVQNLKQWNGRLTSRLGVGEVLEIF